jgi:acyl carrier protein
MTPKFKWTEDELNRVSKEMFRLMTSGRSSVLEHWPAFKLAQSLVNPIYKYSINNPNQKLMTELKKRVAQHFNDCLKKPKEVEVVLSPEVAQAKARMILDKIAQPVKLVGSDSLARTILTAQRNIKIRENSTEVRVKKIVAEMLGLNVVDVKNESTFEELGADSLDLIEIVMEVEENFGYDIPDEDAERLFTVQHAIDYINYKFPDLSEKSEGKVRTLLTGHTVNSLDHFVAIQVVTNCPLKYVLVDLETGEQFGVDDPTVEEIRLGTYKPEFNTRPIRRVSIPKAKK